MSLKLEVGKHYVNGFGKRVGPMLNTDDRSSYEWYSSDWESYTKEGLYWADQTSKHDLVSEWVDPKVEPDVLPFGKLTPEEQGALLLAEHKGAAIQSHNSHTKSWVTIVLPPAWYDDKVYRIKPKPKMQNEYWVVFNAEGNPLYVSNHGADAPSKGDYPVYHPAVEMKDTA